MDARNLFILLFLALAAVLAVVAAFVEPVQARLLCLAVACIAIALFIEKIPS